MLKNSHAGRPSLVKSSAYREQIDDMITEGVKPLEISAWLKKQDPPENISKSTIYDYMKLDFNVGENAVQWYSDLKSQERLDKAGEGRASDMRNLKAFIEKSLGIKLDLNISVDERTTKLDIEKHKLQVVRAGAREYVYTPIIEGVANEFLQMHGILDGYLEVEFNPFLSRNLVEAAGIIRDVWPTGTITVNEVRSRLDLPPLSDEELEENKENLGEV